LPLCPHTTTISPFLFFPSQTFLITLNTPPFSSYSYLLFPPAPLALTNGPPPPPHLFFLFWCSPYCFPRPQLLFPLVTLFFFFVQAYSPPRVFRRQLPPQPVQLFIFLPFPTAFFQTPTFDLPRNIPKFWFSSPSIFKGVPVSPLSLPLSYLPAIVLSSPGEHPPLELIFFVPPPPDSPPS